MSNQKEDKDASKQPTTTQAASSQPRALSENFLLLWNFTDF
jgi:hypothetical protein